MIDLITEIAERYQVTASELLSKKRKMPLPQARHEVFAKVYYGGSTQIAIAEKFGVTQSAVSKGIITNFLNKH